jgi:kumamolisin
MAKSRSKPSVPHVPHNYVAIPGSERRPSKTARLIGPADPNEVLDVTIVLRRRPDGPNLPDHDDFLATPPAQRPRMSEEEFAAKYGASQEDIDKVVAVAQSHGLTVVETSAAQRMVVVQGTVAQMSAAFAGSDLRRVTHPDRLKVTHLGVQDSHPGRGW